MEMGTAIVAVAVVAVVAALAIAAVAVAEPQLRTGHLLHIAHMATKNTTIFPSKYMSNHVNTTYKRCVWITSFSQISPWIPRDLSTSRRIWVARSQ